MLKNYEEREQMKILSIVGARPQFIKLAPFIKAYEESSQDNQTVTIEHKIIHTGQHYDYHMDKVFFEQLGIPDPDYNLEVRSGSHGWQIGEMIKRLEPVLQEEKPDVVLAYGDTNSTLAGALVASKLRIFLAHVESGLRSFNRDMPEEINRILTDHCSDVLFVPTLNAAENLKNEGFKNIRSNGFLFDQKVKFKEKKDHSFPVVFNVGDIMYDAVLFALEIAEKRSTILTDLKLQPQKYFIVTIHRAENTNDLARLESILDALIHISKQYPIIFPMHPRVRKIIDQNPPFSEKVKNLRVIEPVNYFDMLILQKNAKKVLTDSGGMQKEAFFLKVPCVTLRDETEWVETIQAGCNVLTGAEKDSIVEKTLQKLDLNSHSFSGSFFGDGFCAKRMVTILSDLNHSLYSGQKE